MGGIREFVVLSGRLQWQIRRAFLAHPERQFRTAELIEWCYPRTGKLDYRHRWIIVRAAAKVAVRVERQCQRSPAGLFGGLAETQKRAADVRSTQICVDLQTLPLTNCYTSTANVTVGRPREYLTEREVEKRRLDRGALTQRGP
jgi:hypothetical protein